jgi:hypothetical protein
MIGKVIHFLSGGPVEGTILDKVRHYHINGRTGQHVPIDVYVVVDESGNVYLIAPESIKKVENGL